MWLVTRSADTDHNRFSIPDCITNQTIERTQEMTPDMTNVVEFIRIRQRIELLIKQIAVSTEQKVIPETNRRFEEATQLLAALTALANNDVQETAVTRLTRQLATLGKKVGSLKGKKRVAKKQLVV